MNAVERYKQRRKERLITRMHAASTTMEAACIARALFENYYRKEIRKDGGPGSGNWGHESVVGVRGGSKPGGGKQNRQGSPENGYTSEAKERVKEKSEGKTAALTKSVMPSMPQRPKLSDFEDYDALLQARAKYQEERDKWKQEVSKRVSEQVPEHSMTASEINSWCEKNNVEIYGSLDGVDGRLLTAYTQRWEQLSADFPEGANFILKDDVTGEEFVSNFCMSYTGDMDYVCEASGGINIGERCSDAEYTAQYILESQGEGFMVNTNQGLNSLFDHEYGHRVYNSLQYQEGFTTEDRWAMRQDLISSVYGKSGMSEYATTSADELFAEGFAAYYAGETTDFAKATGEFISRWRNKS